MKFEKKDLNLKDGIRKEWVMTNGLGAICSSTIIGANTRRYHGLLVAPLMQPARRHLFISKVDESIEIGNERFNLYTNVCRNYVSDGYKYLESFEKTYIPKFQFDVNGIKIEKQVSMVFEKNIVVVTYKIYNKQENVKLILTPILNFRDFHDLTTNCRFSLKQKIEKSKVRVEINGNGGTPVYMHVTDGKYIVHENDTFENMYYLKEEERGFFPEENLSVPGRYEVEIKPNEIKEITFAGSLEENIEEINGFEVIEKEIERQRNVVTESKLLKKSKSKDAKEYNEFVQKLVLATDKFVIKRQSFGTYSILAGIPWFLDWGRDAFIAYEGSFLVTKRYEIAKSIFRTAIRDIKFGLVPNGYSGFDNRPLYNSVDASLLLFEQINKYLKYTKDYDFVKEELYEKLVTIITNYGKGIDLSDNNIYVDKDGLLVSGTEQTQNTWMDAKIGELVVTPRNGKVVEINALWYNALKTLEALAKKFGDKEVEVCCNKAAAKHKREFKKKFYNPRKKCLYDVLGDGKVRPNQLFALSTTYPVLDLKSEEAKNVFKTVTDKLLLKHGLRTLAANEKNYIAIYEGDAFKRDMSYHQGPSWTWLLGLYFDAYKNMLNAETKVRAKQELEKGYKAFLETTYKTFKKAIDGEQCIGSISEIYDSKAPYKPGGTCAQAWSVSEVLKIVVEYGKDIK